MTDIMLKRFLLTLGARFDSNLLSGACEFVSGDLDFVNSEPCEMLGFCDIRHEVPFTCWVAVICLSGPL